MTLVREGTCESCQQPIKVYETQVIGGPRKGEQIEVTYGCKCEDIKLAETALENKAKAEKRQLKEKFSRYSLISKKLIEKTINDYEPKTESQLHAKRTIERFIEIFSKDNPKNLLLTGGFGVGKSHLSKVLTDGVLEKGFTAIFISVPKLLRRIRSTYNQDSKVKEDDILDVLEKVDVLVLDDIGAEKQSEWASEKLFDVIDSRQGMHTIYTTNYEPNDLMDLLGERNFSRVVNEDTTVIEIDGPNYRFSDLGE